jgi:hypothetical protein
MQVSFSRVFSVLKPTKFLVNALLVHVKYWEELVWFPGKSEVIRLQTMFLQDQHRSIAIALIHQSCFLNAAVLMR